jgi:hypothetical protein
MPLLDARAKEFRETLRSRAGLSMASALLTIILQGLQYRTSAKLLAAIWQPLPTGARLL